MVAVAAHGLATGDVVYITGVTGGADWTAATLALINDNYHTIYRTAAGTFVIPIDTSAFATPATGGTVTSGQFTIQSTDETDTSTVHWMLMD